MLHVISFYFSNYFHPFKHSLCCHCGLKCGSHSPPPLLETAFYPFPLFSLTFISSYLHF